MKKERKNRERENKSRKSLMRKCTDNEDCYGGKTVTVKQRTKKHFINRRWEQNIISSKRE